MRVVPDSPVACVPTPRHERSAVRDHTIGTVRSPTRTAPETFGSAHSANVSSVVIKYLEAHQGSARYMVAAVGSDTAGEIALQSARNVIDMGGFMGADPAPTLAQVRHLIDTRQLHYILLGGSGGGPGATGASDATVETRDRWIENHGAVVHVTGQSTSGAGAKLYYFAG